jgi:hypothetical protein
MAKKPGQSKRNGQSKRPAVTIQTPVSNAQMLKNRTALGMPAVRPKARTATPSKAPMAKSSPTPMTVTARPGVMGASGRAYKNIAAGIVGEWTNPASPARQAASRISRDVASSRDNMPAPDLRGKTTPAPAVTVFRPALASKISKKPAPRPAAPAPSAVARPVPLPPRRPAAQSTSNLPAGGYSPRTMSGDYSTAQPKLDTNKGYEPNKTGFFDKLHRSLGGKGNATYKYPTGDNRSDKD